MVILMCYFSREHIALSLKNGADIELGKTNRLKALSMMQNNTWHKPRQSMKQKTFAKINSQKKKEALYKQTGLVKAASSIK